ncbi:hypothetical protein [Xenorhabdus bovienii]|uniref:Uncharacterized protein n=1 Tax=Xenorhabdus bovienii str. feltiae Moldova TaxID=1398200 RepID=A0A077NQ54_XENBV|nr:hypothetical protein [Xenorhabdus bovienii]CDG99811.1 hypothetical protein XBFM1_1210001 [Xenorhabdus bovienii str. feltiae Moldova]
MNTNAYTLIGRAICQLLDNNTPIYKTTITESMSDIFNAEYRGIYDEHCETFNDALKLLMNKTQS